MPPFDFNSLVLFGIALVNAFTAYLAYRTHQSTIQNTANIVELEKNTNSIKDALIVSTAKASLAEGMAAGRLEQRTETAEAKKK